jgi:transposase
LRASFFGAVTTAGKWEDMLLNRVGPRTIVLADKAYDADRIRLLIKAQRATPNTPPKSNRRCNLASASVSPASAT